MTTTEIDTGHQPDDRVYKIGQLAREFDVTLRTLRFYEDKGLLTPQRIGTTRLYSRSDRGRLRIIVMAKRLGFSLQDIKTFLELYNPAEQNTAQLKFFLERGETHLEELRDQERTLAASISELTETIATVREMIGKETPKAANAA
ncbi:MAG: MerR family DNA-binding transcriptional regulator [Pseudomonadota bacterium]